ncbi:MAG: O-antigen ligase family protein [Candidatus Kuenenbacteria bacterium]
MYYLLTIYLILFIILSYRRIDWAIFLIVFTLPSYLIRFQILGIPTTLLELMILMLFLIWAIKKLGNWEIGKLKQIITNYKLYFFIILFLLAATLSVFISPNLRSALGIWKAYFIEPILFFIVFINIIDKNKLKNIFTYLASSTLVLSLFAIYQKITGNFISNPFWQDEATRRVTSVFEYPNALALFLAPLVVLMIGWLIQRRGAPCGCPNGKGRGKPCPYEIFISLTIILGLLSIYFTKSKGAILGILAGLIFYAIFYKGYRKYFAGLIIISFISLFLYFSISNSPILNTLKGSSTVEGGDSISTRLDMWSETWEMLKTKPITGAGLSGFQTAVAPYHHKEYIEIFLYPHNIFLNFWSEIGILGLLTFLLMIVWFYIIGFKNIKYQTSNILMAGMTCLLVHGLVDVPYFKNDLSILFWLLISGMVISNKKIIWKTDKIC